MKKKYTLLFFVLLSLSSFAQKLPEVQEKHISVPSNIKIDGKANEWNDSFAAENKRTGLFYSLVNDDKNLYLVIKSSSTANTNKIMLGGISFTINNKGKKKEKDAIIITYPIINRVNRQQGGRAMGQNRQGSFQNRVQQTVLQRDSALIALYKTQLLGVKEIKVVGFKAITDSLISIYNEYSIKAVASFDKNGTYIYELAVPLKLLELSLTGTNEFAYQIKVNGLSNMNFGGNREGGFNSRNIGGNRNVGTGFNNAGGNQGQDLMSATDFWSKYILQK